VVRAFYFLFVGFFFVVLFYDVLFFGVQSKELLKARRLNGGAVQVYLFSFEMRCEAM